MGLPSTFGISQHNAVRVPVASPPRIAVGRGALLAAMGNCIVYYQPCRAFSYADSKINLANPGTYDAVERTGVPDWDAIDGWWFTGAQCLTTRPVNGGNYSVIVRFSGAPGNSTGRLVGCAAGSDSQPRLFIVPVYGGTTIYWNNGNATATSTPACKAGVLAIAGNKAYRNGIDEGIVIPAWSSGSAANLGIGGQNGSSGTYYRLPCMVQAVVIYDYVLTAQQVAQVSAALAML